MTVIAQISVQIQLQPCYQYSFKQRTNLTLLGAFGIRVHNLPSIMFHFCYINICTVYVHRMPQLRQPQSRMKTSTWTRWPGRRPTPCWNGSTVCWNLPVPTSPRTSPPPRGRCVPPPLHRPATSRTPCRKAPSFALNAASPNVSTGSLIILMEILTLCTCTATISEGISPISRVSVTISSTDAAIFPVSSRGVLV